MKRVWFVLVLIGALFLYVNHQRLFLHDPMAKVTRDGVALQRKTVMINYTNDVLLYDQSEGRDRTYLVQNWNQLPSVPRQLTCLIYLGCLADHDHVTAAPILGAKTKPAVMTNKRVEFIDEEGKKIVVTLR